MILTGCKKNSKQTDKQAIKLTCLFLVSVAVVFFHSGKHLNCKSVVHNASAPGTHETARQLVSNVELNKAIQSLYKDL